VTTLNFIDNSLSKKNEDPVHMPSISVNIDSTSLIEPDVSLCEGNVTSHQPAKASTPRRAHTSVKRSILTQKPYFAPVKKQKLSNIANDLSAMLDFKTNVLKHQTETANAKEKRESEIHNHHVQALVNAEKRSAEIHELLVKQKLLEMQEKELDIQIKEMQLKMLKNQQIQS